MPKPAGTLEINGFVSPELKAAFVRKCKSEGRTQNWVITYLLSSWVAGLDIPASMPSPPPAPRPPRRAR